MKGSYYIVTGGLGGIGAGIVKLLKEKGINVLVTTSQKNKVNNESIFYWSMKNSQSTKELIKDIKEKKYDIVGFIHCAHIFSKPELLLQVKVDELMDSISNNFIELFNLTKFLLKKMSRKNNGVILFLGSLISERPHIGKTSYIIEKNMLSGLIKSIHGDFNSKGIRASILHPGLVSTKQIKDKMTTIELKEFENDKLLSVEEVSKYAISIIESGHEVDTNKISFEMAGKQKWW